MGILPLRSDNRTPDRPEFPTSDFAIEAASSIAASRRKGKGRKKVDGRLSLVGLSGGGSL